MSRTARYVGTLPQAQWTEKAIAIDPRRAIAYANLGDAYFQLNRLDDACRVYQSYLELAPNGRMQPPRASG